MASDRPDAAGANGGTLLVTGGAGFIGTHLRAAYTSRHPDRTVVTADLVATGTDVSRRVDLRRPGDLTALPAADAVLHLAALSREPGHPIADYFETNTEGTAALLEWASRMGVRTIVFTSSMAVFGPTEQPVAEDGPFRPETAYGTSKLLAEHLVRRWEAESPERRAVIVRPGVVFGVGEEGNFDRLRRAVARRWFVLPGRRDTRKAAVYVHDLDDLLLHLLEHPRRGLTVNAAYDECWTIGEIAAHLAARAGRARPPVVVPERAVRAAFGVLRLTEVGRPDHTRTFHPRRVDKLVHSTWMVPQRLADVPFSFRHDMRSALDAWIDEVEATHGDAAG